MSLRKRVDELERDVKRLWNAVTTYVNDHDEVHRKYGDLMADLIGRDEQEETAEYSLPIIDMTDVPPYCEIRVTMTVGRTKQPGVLYMAIDRRNQIRGIGETQAEALAHLSSRQPVVQPDERAEESPSLLDAIRTNIDRCRSTYLGEGASEEVLPQPRQLAEAQYAVGQHVQVNTLGEWEDATVMSINECDVCPGTYQIATDATETCRHERDVRTAPDGTDRSDG